MLIKVLWDIVNKVHLSEKFTEKQLNKEEISYHKAVKKEIKYFFVCGGGVSIFFIPGILYFLIFKKCI